MSDNQQTTILRFALIFLAITVGFIAVLVKIVLIQTTERRQWLKIAENQVRTNQTIRANRGNILDADGRIMASSMPQYLVYFDAGVEPLHQGGDTLFHNHLSELSHGLSRIIGDKSAEQYRQLLTSSHHKRKRSVRLSKRRINYIQRRQLEQLPLLKLGKNKSGITFEDKNLRIKPFGSLASRTLGNIDVESGVGRTGLEARFNSDLSGHDGVSTRQRIGNRWENITIEEAIDGRDVVTTLDANLQDIAETSLRAQLEHAKADWGCCILMETKTGKIKAISNLDAQPDGSYIEAFNHAVIRVEPGSTFKTIALVAALDDDKIDIDDTIHVTREPWKYLGIKHTDAHPRDTFYTVRSALAVSSNIALAKIITHGYEGSAKKFVRRIEKMGLCDSIYCEIPGAQAARITVPRDTVTLSKMSYGYSVELTPMQILMFYNAIANDGRMIRPYLVSEIQENGRTVRTFKTETIRSSICKKSTLRDIRGALHDVVWDNHLGTASVNPWGMRKAQSKAVPIAGKTGTAQLFQQGKYWGSRHRMTFVGYFPEDDPQYTCICMIEYPKTYGYDAGMDCGSVVRRIAEKTIAYTGCYTIQGDSLVLNSKL